MSLDWFMCFIALSIGIVSKDSVIISCWLLINILLLSIVDYTTYYTWFKSMALWAALFSAKDFILLTIMAKMRAPLIIVLALFASCTFHQFLRFQIMTYNYSNLTLLEYRSTFMLLLSVIMLATVISNSIGGGNGGKRVRAFIAHINNRLGCLFRHQVQRTR